MALYQISAFEAEINRRAVLLDTNVLCAAFDPSDNWHQDADTFLELCEDPFFVSMEVVVEAWGLLAGARKRRLEALNLMLWLNNPGKVSLLPQQPHFLGGAYDLMNSVGVDCVDALLSRLAHDVSTQSFPGTDMAIATYDVPDMVNCKYKQGLRIRIIDLRSGDLAEY
jgi:predicted nucleic acid-binding protein